MPSHRDPSISRRHFMKFVAGSPLTRRSLRCSAEPGHRIQDRPRQRLLRLQDLGGSDRWYYLLDRWKRRVELPALKSMVATLGEQFKPSVVLVEDKASGQSLIPPARSGHRPPPLGPSAIPR